MLGECVISSVLSCCSKNLKWWTDNVTVVLFRKQKKIHPQGVRVGWSKRLKEKRSPRLNFWLLFLCFFSSSWACPIYTGLVRSVVCFTWSPHSSPQTFLCSIFLGFPLPYILATTILIPFSYFNCLTDLLFPYKFWRLTIWNTYSRWILFSGENK